MEATRRQRTLRALTLMLVGMVGGLALSLDPLAALRSPPFLAMAFAMCAWTVVENLALRQDEPKQYRHKLQTRIMQAIVMLAAFLGTIDLFHLPFAHPLWLVPVGVLCIAAGAAIRIVAIRTLERHFSYELRIEQGHELVRRGIYRVLRHPSYLGIVLVTIGAALTLASVLAALVAGAAMAGVAVWRIRDEEAMLRGSFGPAYDAYADDTWRLLPYVY